MPTDVIARETGQPVPRAPNVSRGWLSVFLVIPPVAWFLQTVAGFALVANGCTGAGPAGAHLAEGWGWLWNAVLVMNIVAVAAAAAATAAGYAVWRRARSEAGGPRYGLIAVGEGSDRFLASWAVLGGAFFFTMGTIFTTIIIFLVPLCAS